MVLFKTIAFVLIFAGGRAFWEFLRNPTLFVPPTSTFNPVTLVRGSPVEYPWAIEIPTLFFPFTDIFLPLPPPVTSVKS